MKEHSSRVSFFYRASGFLQAIEVHLLVVVPGSLHSWNRALWESVCEGAIRGESYSLCNEKYVDPIMSMHVDSMDHRDVITR